MKNAAVRFLLLEHSFAFRVLEQAFLGHHWLDSKDLDQRMSVIIYIQKMDNY